jgi:RNA polymerase sigma-70 factor, ECF subfamily
MSETSEVFDVRFDSTDAIQGDSSREARARDDYSRNPFALRLVAAQQGSRRAIGTVLEDCRSYLLLIANQKLGPSIQAKIGASDLVQETFLQAEAIFDRFQGTSRQELTAWLARIFEYKLAEARRQYLNTQKRDATREQSLHFSPTEVFQDRRLHDRPAAEKITLDREELECVRRILDQLPPDYRTAIELRGFEQKSFDDLGHALNRSAEVARMVWARAMLRLQKELQAFRETRPGR